MRMRIQKKPLDVVAQSKRQGVVVAKVYACKEFDQILETGRELILTAQLGPGVVLDRRLKGVSERVAR